MRRSRVLLALLVIHAAAVIATGCADEPVPTPVTGGNALQPLSDDMTWIYRPSGDFADDRTPVVIAVVGREQVDGETAWLVGQNVGQSYATRAVSMTRGGEVWTIGFDELVDGRWSRWTLDAPQLTQPAPAARRWDVDFSSGPEAWRWTAAWEQRASGAMSVLGRSGTAWLAIGDLKQQGAMSREIDTLVEGIGAVKLDIVGEGFRLRWDLVSFGTEPGRMATELVGALGDDIVRLTMGAPPRLTIGDGQPQPVASWLLDGERINFEFDGADGRRVEWDGRLTPFGLAGTAKAPDGSTRVMDLVSLLPE